jgi:dGTPase
MAIETGRERAPYSCDPRLSRGRAYSEPPSRTRNAFRRDCDRVIHASAFRRLKHKTQVFVFDEGDHYRTRLTHTLEVVQVARALARSLGLDEDLAEALALAHDLGHPPFGHAGEQQLDRCLERHGGFDHNVQTLRVVTEIERRYPEFDGLNLTWETLEGIVKHNGPLTDRTGTPVERYRKHGVPATVRHYAEVHDTPLFTHASAEAQVAAIADDIAYDAHDIDDGLRAGLFVLDELRAVALLDEMLQEIGARYPRLDPARRCHALIRRLIARMIEDVVGAAGSRLVSARSPDDVRAAGMPLVGFSPAIAAADRGIKEFLYPRMYRHPRVLRIMAAAQHVIHDLFAHYSAHPESMPHEWADGLAEMSDHDAARRIGDFIAGMTDRYALIEHARFFDSTPELV